MVKMYKPNHIDNEDWLQFLLTDDQDKTEWMLYIQEAVKISKSGTKYRIVKLCSVKPIAHKANYDMNWQEKISDIGTSRNKDNLKKYRPGLYSQIIEKLSGFIWDTWR